MNLQKQVVSLDDDLIRSSDPYIQSLYEQMSKINKEIHSLFIQRMKEILTEAAEKFKGMHFRFGFPDFYYGDYIIEVYPREMYHDRAFVEFEGNAMSELGKKFCIGYCFTEGGKDEWMKVVDCIFEIDPKT